MQSSCNPLQLDKLGGSRNFLQYPDPCTCSRITTFYGRICQMMEVDDVTDTVRGDTTPLRSWNRDQQLFCDVGEQQTPPGTDTVTVRFYELCEAGIPLPFTLDECRWRVIINHGLCRSLGSYLNSWSNYAEVYDLQTNSRNMGRRTSRDGADDPRTIDITATVFNRYQIGPIRFGRITTTEFAPCTPAELRFGKPEFACNVGCGQTVCNCQEPCGDGSDTFYVPAYCTGSQTGQYVATVSNCGVTKRLATLPNTSNATSVVNRPPVISECNGQLYALAYSTSPELYRIALDRNGLPTGQWTLVATLPHRQATAPTVVQAGDPGQLVCSNGTLHILVQDATNGARYYRYDPALNRVDLTNASQTFQVAANMSRLNVCNNTVLVSGDNNNLQISTDGGNTFRALSVPTGLTGTINGIENADNRIIISTSTGEVWFTPDFGRTWTSAAPGGTDGTSQVAPGNSLIRFAGDDVGYFARAGQLFATWGGGLTTSDWTNQAPRINDFPTTFNPNFIAVPECGPGYKRANTVLMVDDRNIFLGQTNISGI